MGNLKTRELININNGNSLEVNIDLILKINLNDYYPFSWACFYAHTSKCV